MGNHHNHSDNNTSKNGLTLAFWMNALFSVIELIGGILTNSTAIITDAFHDFMDAVSIGIAILFQKISNKERSETYSYGYKRFSLLSAVIMSVVLLVGAILMTIKAVQSFMQPQEVNSLGMLWLAILGIAINGFAFLRIKSGDAAAHHGHSHGPDHNTKAIMLHLLEDVLGWIAVLIGAIIIYFTNWYWIDSLLAIGIAIFIGYNAINNLLSAVKIFLQSVPLNVNMLNLSDDLAKVNGVLSTHDLHVWTLDGTQNIASVHIVINDNFIGKEQELYQAISAIMDKHKVQHPTIQLETKDSNCKLIGC